MRGRSLRALGAFTSRIGSIVRRNGLGTRAEVERALELQARAKELGVPIKLGDVFLRTSVLDIPTRDALLCVQQSWRKSPQGLAPSDPPATVKRTSARFGELAVTNGLVTEEAVARALEIQRRTRPRGASWHIGEILVRERMLEEPVVDALLRIQRRRNQGESESVQRLRRMAAREPLRWPDLLFGQVALRHGFVSAEQLDEALKVRRRVQDAGASVPIGEVFLMEGILSEEHLAKIAEIRDVEREICMATAPSPVGIGGTEESSLGALLCEKAGLSAAQVGECRRVQRELAKLGLRIPFGEILVEKGFARSDAVHSALEEQVVRRRRAESARRLREVLQHGLVRSVALAIPLCLVAWTWPTAPAPARAPGTAASAAAAAVPAPRASRAPARVAAHPRLAQPLPFEGLSTQWIVDQEAALRADLDREERTRNESRARRALADCESEGLAVALTLRNTPQGTVFETYGQIPLPDGTRVRTTVLYFGQPIPAASKTVLVRRGMFLARTGPLPDRPWVPPGLYTAAVSIHGERDAEFVQAGSGAACSAYLGSPEEEADYAAHVREGLEFELGRLETWHQEILAAVDGSAEAWAAADWSGYFEDWHRRLREIEEGWLRERGRCLASRFADVQRAVDPLLSEAHRVLRGAATRILGACGIALPRSLAAVPDDERMGVVPQETLARMNALLRTVRTRLAEAAEGDPILAYARRDLRRRVETAWSRWELLNADPHGCAGGCPGAESEVALAACSPEDLARRWRADLEDLLRPDPGLGDVTADEDLVAYRDAAGEIFRQLIDLGEARILAAPEDEDERPAADLAGPAADVIARLGFLRRELRSDDGRTH